MNEKTIPKVAEAICDCANSAGSLDALWGAAIGGGFAVIVALIGMYAQHRQFLRSLEHHEKARVLDHKNAKELQTLDRRTEALNQMIEALDDAVLELLAVATTGKPPESGKILGGYLKHLWAIDNDDLRQLIATTGSDAIQEFETMNQEAGKHHTRQYILCSGFVSDYLSLINGVRTLPLTVPPTIQFKDANLEENPNR